MHKCINADMQTGRQADRQTGRHADMQTCRHAYRQTGRQADMQTGRQAGSRGDWQVNEKEGDRLFAYPTLPINAHRHPSV